MPKLNTFVHVVELDADGKATGQAAVFGPDDDLPEWAVAAVSNPDVWAEPPAPQQEAEVPPQGGDPDVPDPAPSPKVPPRGGAGSGRDAWAAYAVANGVTVTDDLKSRDDIIAACELANVPVE